jgi:branched-chain amino acid aminotransferase
MRLAAGAPFRLDAHVARLARSAAWLGVLPENAAAHRMRGALDVALERAAELGVREGSIRTTLTRGPGAPGLAPAPDGWPTLTVAIHPRPGPRGLPAPLSAVVTTTGRRNERAASGAHKTLSYADAIIALADAHARGADDAIFLDTVSTVACGTASNVVVVLRGVIVTPPAGGAVLPGVTRAEVIALARVMEKETVQRPVGADELRDADEIWLTSSIRGVAPVVRLDGRAVGGGTVGPVWRRMHDAYESAVAASCRA